MKCHNNVETLMNYAFCSYIGIFLCREIESKIEGLHRSQTSGSVSSFPRASTPNNNNN